MDADAAWDFGPYAQVIEDLAHAVVVTDAAGMIVLWNRAAASLVGWSSDEATTRHVDEILVFEPGHRLDDVPGQAPAAVLPCEGVRWIRHRDGSLVPVCETRTDVRDAVGSVTHQIVEITDASGRVSAERRLQAFDTAPHGWAVSALDGRFVTVNHALCEILGCERTDVLGRHPQEFSASDDDERVPISAMLAGQIQRDSFSCRTRFTRPDGATRWVDVDVRLIRSHNGRPEHFFGYVRDVTEWLDSTDRYLRLFSSVVNSFAASHELSDPFTAGHQQRVARLATAIAQRIGLDADAMEGLAVGAVLHDIGKVATPVQLLIKPGRLEAAEYELVKRHARSGHDIVAHIDFPWPIAEIILQHHERIDGSGYPRGLVGEEILLESRIIAVADTVETIISHRPYKPARPLMAALDAISAERARLFDPGVVDACLATFEAGFSLDEVQ